MSRLRVAIVAPSLRILGGQSVQADRLVRAWQDDPDVDAWLLPVNPLPPAPLRWMTRVKYLRTLVTEVLYGARLACEIRRADVVHIFSASYSSFLLAPLPAIAAAKAFGKPMVLNYHSGEAHDHLQRSRIARTVLARTDRNVVPSQFLVDVFARFDLPAVAVANIIEPGDVLFVERTHFRPSLVSTRSFESHYNVACTLRAFQIVQQRYPDATLTLIGDGSQLRALQALAADLGLRRVTFAGRTAPEAIGRACAAHDIYIQSPDIDNMPLSILDAFAGGLPVVTTNAGGIPYMLSHETNGLLAPVNDHAALAAHVLRIVETPSHGRRLAAAGYASSTAFTWPRVRDEWLRVYRTAAASRERTAPAAPRVAVREKAGDER